jgi:hypothetical protein
MLLGTVGLNHSQVIIGQVHNMVGEKNETSMIMPFNVLWSLLLLVTVVRAL